MTTRIAALCLSFIAFGCASSATNPSATKAARSEAVAAQNADTRTPSERREAQLLDALAKAEQSKMPPRELSKQQALALNEVALLRQDRGDDAGAVEAIERAVRESWYAGDRELQDRCERQQVLFKRIAALNVAKKGDVAKSLRMLDQIQLVKGLTNEERRLINGDRLMLQEQQSQGSTEEINVAALFQDIDRNFGMSTLIDAFAPQGKTIDSGSSRRRNDESAVALTQPKLLEGAKPIATTHKDGVSQSALPEDEGAPLVETGVIDQQVVSRMVVLNRRSIEACYDKSIRSGSKLGGKLEVGVLIQPSGEVTRADVMTPAFRDSELGRCVTSTLRRWRFPPTRGKAKQMTVPFMLGRPN